MESLKIIATIKSKSEFINEIESVLKQLVSESRKEDGNISYLLHRDLKNADEFIVIEEWKSSEAIDFHNNTSHFKDFLNAISGKTEDVQINVIKQIM